MGKLGGILLAAAIALTACAAPNPGTSKPEVQRASVTEAKTSVQQDMLSDLRPHLRTLNASDADLVREGFEACAALLVTNKDAFRADLLKQYSADPTLGLDHLTVAAAAKQYLCP